MRIEQGDFSAIEETASGQTLDEWLELLAKPKTRITLAYLHDHPNATVDELATAIAGKTAVETGRIVTEAEYDEACIYLYHSILPRLDDYGVLEYDHAESAVRDATIPAAVVAVLEIDE
ncbi:hypothetical protein C482_03934 [Natrialba chahannaoensis JCM 10990]|uniref:DUF7344 domain-containing protein n=1 Tax=Natrialba chahannaoensis JCM 10990 TaxID=1227492 RepID=M0AWT7_9EURY|nr:hypothetical protein [Natrialba chahannaoensis]ELZ03141.1 hypothetical protein C482_03934 [Natrialba chahannaoensis JCM 10990]